MATKPKVVYLRNVPADLVNKLKAAAALSGGQSIQKYVVQLLLEHVAELERKGQLPKGRGSGRGAQVLASDAEIAKALNNREELASQMTQAQVGESAGNGSAMSGE